MVLEIGSLRHSELDKPLPLLYNPDAGSIDMVCSRLAGDKRIQLVEAPIERMSTLITKAKKKTGSRILVSGGDGTIARAASEIAGTGMELAVIPGGTLNHFAERLEIPDAPEKALDLALYGRSGLVGTGYVNGKMFINTCAVGAYPVFVRTREYLEHRMSYLTASFFAGVRRLARYRNIRILIDQNEMRTPMVFVGVQEREVRFPWSGKIKENGSSGLHLITVDCEGLLEMLKLVFSALLLGIDPLSRQRKVTSRVLDQFELTFRKRKRRVNVALDGELVWLHSPLVYRYMSDNLKVVTGWNDNVKMTDREIAKDSVKS